MPVTPGYVKSERPFRATSLKQDFYNTERRPLARFTASGMLV